MSLLPYLLSADKSKCTGCSACANICAHHAIRMEEDEEGFLFPVKNIDLCVNCGLCEKLCPYVSSQSNLKYAQKSYLITTKKEEYYKHSATIGISTMLGDHVIDEGGVVFGVCLDEDSWKAYHKCVDNKIGLETFRNSKYMQSDVKSSFKDARRMLNDGKLVMFTGTPCQIAGLKSFLRKDYSNLLTVELICHGTYSYKLIQKEVDYWEKRLKGKLKNLKFRSKQKFPWSYGGVVNFDIVRHDNHDNEIHYEYLGKYSPTYRCYAYAGNDIFYNLRECCYNCHFRDTERYADITIGDSWFINYKKFLKVESDDYMNGISLVICNTQKGDSYLARIKSYFDKMIMLPNEEAFVQPALKIANHEIPEKRYELYRNIGYEDYGVLVDRILDVNLEKLYVFENSVISKIRRMISKFFLCRYFVAIKNRITPGLEWWFTNNFLCNFPSNHFRKFCLRRMGMKIHRDVKIYSGFHIRNPHDILIEKGVSIGPKVLLDGRKKLSIRESAVIGYGAIIWTLNHDYNDIHFCGKGAPVVIGRYSWVCSNSVILPGITIGEYAVIASGAIVTHDVPPYAIVAGIPAKIIGYREKKKYDYGYQKKDDFFHFC